MLYNVSYLREEKMAPKIRFKKEEVADAAFRIVRRTGWDSLTARKVAKELKSSTMPIYRYLKSMDTIAGEIRKKTLDLLVEYQVKKYTDNPFINLAIGYVDFAVKEKNLFMFYFMEMAKKSSWTGQNNMRMLALKKAGVPDEPPQELGFNKKEWEEVGMRSWIFTHGLAAIASGGVMQGLDVKEIERLLMQNGNAVIMDMITKKKGVKK
jgi:AcrR family transcriptional regulator